MRGKSTRTGAVRARATRTRSGAVVVDEEDLIHKLFVLVDKWPKVQIVVCSPRLDLYDALFQELLALP